MIHSFYQRMEKGEGGERETWNDENDGWGEEVPRSRREAIDVGLCDFFGGSIWSSVFFFFDFWFHFGGRCRGYFSTQEIARLSRIVSDLAHRPAALWLSALTCE